MTDAKENKQSIGKTIIEVLGFFLSLVVVTAAGFGVYYLIDLFLLDLDPLGFPVKWLFKKLLDLLFLICGWIGAAIC